MARRKSRVEMIERADRTGMSIFNAMDAHSMHQSLNGEFMLYQVLVKRLLQQNAHSPANDMGLNDYFQPDDESDQQTMIEYDRTYKPSQAIYWYTKESCIYRMLNKALRTQNVHHILGFGSFIRDLFLQLAAEQPTFVSKLEIPFLQVYRGQFISKNEVVRMKSCTGQLVAINSFLSTSTNRKQALTFATSKSPPSDTLTSVLLEITVYAGVSLRPYADIKSLSAYPKEEEILFVLGCIFRIDAVFEDKESKIWRAKLTLCNDDDEDLKAFLKTMEIDTNGKDPLVILGHYLFQMQKFDEAQTHYETLLDNQLITNDYDIATCHHALAQVNLKKGDLNLALENLKITLEYLSKSNATKDHLLVSQCYNDYAAVYCKKGDFIQALTYYNKALITKNNNSITTYTGLADIEIHLGNYKLALEYQNKCLEEQFNVSPSVLAHIYCGIGKIHAAMGDQNQAYTMFEQAIQIQTKALHPKHPDLGYTYNAIGVMYLDLDDGKKALKFFQKAYEIQSESLPRNHPDFADTYKNLGNRYLKKGDFSRALQYFNKSLDVQLKTLSSKHPSVCDTYIWIGKVLLERSNYDEALECFHQSLDGQLERKRANDPTLVDMYDLLATTYLRKSDLDQALIYFQKRLDNELERKVVEDMSLLSTYQTIADIYCEKQHFQKALLYYYRMLDCQLQARPFPESAVIDLYTNIGKIYLKKPFDQTFVQFNHSTDGESSKMSPTDISLLDTHNRISNVHFEKRHLDQVFEYFQQCLAEQLKTPSLNDTSSTEIYAILGNIAMEKHDLEKALIYFDELMKHELQTKKPDDPSLADVYKAMGDICFEKHDFDQALSYYNQLFDCKSSIQGNADSNFGDTFMTIGKIYLQTPFEKLLEGYKQSTYDSETRHLHLVSAFFQQRLHDQKKESSEGGPTLIDLLAILGNISFALHDLDLALKYYYQLLKKQTSKVAPEQRPSIAITYKIIANLNYLKRHWDEALTYCHKFMENELERKTMCDSAFIDIYSMMAFIYSEKHDFDQSLRYHDRLIGCHLQKKPLDQQLLNHAFRKAGDVYLKRTFAQILNRLSKLRNDKMNIDGNLMQKKHTGPLLNHFLKATDNSSQNHFSLMELYKIIASIYLEKLDLNSTLIYLHKLLEEASSKESVRTAFFIDLYKALANIYCEKRNFDQGLFYINRFLDCQHRRNSFDTNALIEAHTMMGKIHLQHHHFHQTEHAIQKLYEKPEEHRPSVKEIEKALQRVQFEKRHLDQTITHFKHLLGKQLETLPWDHPSVRDTYITLKHLFLHKGNIPDGVVFFEQLLNQQLESQPLGDLCTANIYEILGHFYAAIKDLPKSLEQHQRSLFIYERYYSSAHPTIKRLRHDMKKHSLLNAL